MDTLAFSQGSALGFREDSMRPKVLVSLSDDRHEFQALQGNEGRAAAERLGLDAEIAYSQGDTARQLKRITGAIDAPARARPVAMVVSSISVGALEPMAYLALTAGIGWIVLDEAKYLDKLRRHFPKGLVALVTTDNRAMGALQAELIRALLPAGGAIVSLEGPEIGLVAAQRREGMTRALGPAFPMLKTISGDWTAAGGESAIADWLAYARSKERPALVAAQNDEMAVGARKAIRALRPAWGDLLYTGCDGLPNGGQRLVREKVLAGTVIQPATVGVSLELIARSLRGEKVPPSTVLQPTLFPSLEEVERTRRG